MKKNNKKPKAPATPEQINAVNDMTKTIALIFATLNDGQQVYLRQKIGENDGRFKMLRYLLDESAKEKIKVYSSEAIQ